MLFLLSPAARRRSRQPSPQKDYSTERTAVQFGLLLFQILLNFKSNIKKRHLKLHYASFTPDPKCENVRINGITFDYFGNTSDETIVAVAKVRFDDADWEEIERAIESRVMFYDSKIVLCSIHQFSRFYWRLNKKHDNIRLVQLKSMG